MNIHMPTYTTYTRINIRRTMPTCTPCIPMLSPPIVY